MAYAPLLKVSAAPVYQVDQYGAPVDMAGMSSFALVTPADGTDIDATRGIMVTETGDVSVRGEVDSTDVVLPSLQRGIVYPFRVVRINATGTTATGIVALR